MNHRASFLLAALSLLCACDQLGIETPQQMEQKKIAEGKAIGSSCRQSGRALEDCYQLNPRAPKAAIFDGWKDMDGYMRENKIEEVKPELPAKETTAKKKPIDAEEAEAADAAPAKKAAGH